MVTNTVAVNVSEALTTAIRILESGFSDCRFWRRAAIDELLAAQHVLVKALFDANRQDQN